MAEHRIRLAKVVQNLREELVEAMAAGEGQPLRFDLEEVRLEAQVMVSQEAAGGAEVKFWVISGELADKEAASRLQKVTLSLKPKAKGGGRIQLGDRR